MKRKFLSLHCDKMVQEVLEELLNTYLGGTQEVLHTTSTPEALNVFAKHPDIVMVFVDIEPHVNVFDVEFIQEVGEQGYNGVIVGVCGGLDERLRSKLERETHCNVVVDKVALIRAIPEILRTYSHLTGGLRE